MSLIFGNASVVAELTTISVELEGGCHSDLHELARGEGQIRLSSA